MKLTVDVCLSCGSYVFPPRALCPTCGAADWRSESRDRGVVEEVTVANGVVIASVRLQAGPLIVARVDGGAAAGDSVLVRLDDGAPVAVRA